MLFSGNESAPAGKSKSQRRKYRPPKDREALVEALVGWRETVFSLHAHHAVVTHRWILPNETITALSRVRMEELRGPETVSEIADRTEEWRVAYASDIYKVIAQFDEDKHLWKLWVDLARSVVKKVRSAAWKKRTRTRYIENAELALIIAEDVLEDITRFRKVVREGKRLLALDGATADDMDRMKNEVDARHSELRWMLEDAVWNLEEHCESLREAIVWRDGLVERDNDDGNDGEGDERAGNPSNTVYLPPPARRSSRQSI